MISRASTLEQYSRMRKVFRSALMIFTILGTVSSVLMIGGAKQLAHLMNQPDAWISIACLGPCGLLICLMSAYRGYFNGQGNMIPTSVTQVIEAFIKLVVGLALAFLIIHLTKNVALAAGGAIIGVTIGSAAFRECTAMTSLNLPDSLKTVLAYAFCMCDSLTAIRTPDCLTTITEQAFSYGSALTALSISDNVTSIGLRSFRNSTALPCVTLPASLESINERIFAYSAALKTIVVKGNVTSIVNDAFANLTALTTLKFWGDAPTDVGTGSLFADTTKVTVYCRDTASGWTTGEHYDAAANTWCSRPLATFSSASGAVTVGAVENGTVTVDKSVAKAGETVTVTATPASGYKLKEILVNGTAIQGNTFTMPAANVTVSATFTAGTPAKYAVTVNAAANGTVTASKTADILAGTKVALTIAAKNGITRCLALLGMHAPERM
jgi:hypothetical protein